ncbi:MAG: hypothetical protein ABI619_11780 [Betaproteobacteria bacterium]
MNSITNDELEKLESELPLASGEAFAAARSQVLASGQSVLQSECGFIYEVFPDGRAKLIDVTDPPTWIDAAHVIHLM